MRRKIYRIDREHRQHLLFEPNPRQSSLKIPREFRDRLSNVKLEEQLHQQSIFILRRKHWLAETFAECLSFLAARTSNSRGDNGKDIPGVSLPLERLALRRWSAGHDWNGCKALIEKAAQGQDHLVVSSQSMEVIDQNKRSP